MKGESTALRWLTLADANGETSRLGLTGGHPMFVVGAGWVHADEAVEGDRIRNGDLQELTVLTADVDTRPQIVHNLEIAGAHTYFAGELEAWGHNLNILRFGLKPGGGKKRQLFNKNNGRFACTRDLETAAQMDLADAGSGFRKGLDGIPINPMRDSGARLRTHSQ